MTKELFNPTVEVISSAIKQADTKEKVLVCNSLIEHAETDFMYFPLQNFIEGIQGLRDQLQAKHEELQSANQIPTA